MTRLKYKVIRLCNTIENKNFDTKPYWLYINRILYALKFHNVVLPIIEYKKNLLKKLNLAIKKVSYKRYNFVLNIKNIINILR